ncbi:hypothetical protein CapIbe_011011 [Capra ibex]
MTVVNELAKLLRCTWLIPCSVVAARAQLLLGMWDLPRPGIEPMSPALVGRFLTTGPPGKVPVYFCHVTCSNRCQTPSVSSGEG